MVSTGFEQLDGVLSGNGYPQRSAILVAGPPGVGKEALGYWFIRSGLLEGDGCVYVTRLAVSEVLEDIRAFHIPTDRSPLWVADKESELKCDINDLTSLSTTIKETLRKEDTGSRRIRIVTDILSSLLMLAGEVLLAIDAYFLYRGAKSLAPLSKVPLKTSAVD